MFETLFPPPGPELARFFAGLQDALDSAAPLRTAHRNQLPLAVKDLSARLTSQRSQLGADYMRSPKDRAAYVHYFLPWNVYRLARLLSGLGDRLSLGAGDRIVDLGAGPLTFALALWAARPDLRQQRLTFHCIDRAKKTMALGLDVFRAVSGPDSRWSFRLAQENMDRGLSAEPGKVRLVTAINALNELDLTGHANRQAVNRLAVAIAARLDAGGQTLFVEPATRLGGRCVMLARGALLGRGLHAHAPCVHSEKCPLDGPRAPGWPHFMFPCLGVPDWLQNISARAGLAKKTAGLAFVLLGREAVESPENAARVLSEPFRLPERGGAWYGCGSPGLLLLLQETPDTPAPRQGDLVRFRQAEPLATDAKSGALEAVIVGSAPAQVELPPAQVEPPPAPAGKPATRRPPRPAKKRPGRGSP